MSAPDPHDPHPHDPRPTPAHDSYPHGTPGTSHGELRPGDATVGTDHLAPDAEERNWAMAAHVGSFVAAYVALGLVAPLVVLLAKGSNSAYVRRHAVESLNFQISVLIYAAIGTALGFVLVFVTLGLALIVVLPLVLAFLVAYVVVVVLATVKASHGADYRYPLTVRLVS